MKTLTFSLFMTAVLTFYRRIPFRKQRQRRQPERHQQRRTGHLSFLLYSESRGGSRLRLHA